MRYWERFKINFLIPLNVLLWKYVKLQFYRYRHTFWELFGSLTLYVIVFLLHRVNLGQSNQIIGARTPDKLLESQDYLVRVFYEPFNSFTQKVMNEAETYLKQNSHSSHRWEFQSIGFPINFHDNFFDTTDGIAQVKFKNKGSFTSDLKYSISVLCDLAESNLDVAFHGVLRSVTPKVEIAPPYLGQLQWAIDKSYIEQLTPKDIDQDIELTAIPDVFKDELLTIRKFLLICNILGPLPYFLAFASKIVEERRSGMKELMRQAGIPSNVRWCAYYLEVCIASILYSIVVTTLLKATNEPILLKSNAFIVGFTIAFHFVNTMCLSFLTTTMCQNIKYSDCLACIMYLMPFILEFMWNSYREYTFIVYYIIPHAPIYLFWDEVFYLERIGEGVLVSNIDKCHSDNFSVLDVWISLLVQQVLTITLAWYFDLVRPGYYGIAKKFYFLFQKNYWRPPNEPKVIKLPPYKLLKKNESHFQKVPKNVEIAVQVLNVSKVFVKSKPQVGVVALDSVSFNCCRGEVTMVLGANGAGKSTLLLMVAGMLSTTDGQVYVNGFEVGTQMHRQNLRLCMQKDMCFRYLTVKENLMFFNKLKKSKEGFTVDYLLKKLKLLEISDHFGYHLSVGTMRCLQVACVLAGDADVLLLDEPTTCMEIEVRLRLWDMLMVLRGNKTIIMATSCLEEANALGDRIVLLDNGALRCHGSPMFLKNIIGTSFTLSIIIKDSARFYDLKELVDKTIPDLECHIHDMTRIVFSLPTKEFENFPELFRILEEQKEHLGIVLMDVGMFMEEVFEKFIDTSARKSKTPNRTRRGVDTVYCRKRIKGCSLIIRQTLMLAHRIFDSLMCQRGLFLTLRFLVPILCLVNITLSSNYSLRNTRLFKENMPEINSKIAKLVYKVSPYSRRGVFDDVKNFPGLVTVYSQNIDKELSSKSAGFSNKETIAFEIADDHIKIIHPNSPRLTTQTVNMFSNIYMSMYLPNNNHTIRTSYVRFNKQKRPVGIIEVKSSYLCLRWSSWVTFISMFPLAPIIILAICERRFGIRDNYMMAGCTPIVFWMAKIISQMSIFMVVIVIPLLVICVFLDLDRTFLQPKFMGSVFSILFVFGLAFHTFLYMLSFRLHENSAICQIYISSVFFGVVLPALLSVLEVFAEKMFVYAIPYYIFECIARLNPLYALGVGLARLTLTARLNAFCQINKNKCPNLTFDDESFDVDICCGTSFEPFSYLVSYETGLFDLVTLFIQFIVYWTLIILLEYKIPQNIREIITFRRYQKPWKSEEEPNSVLKERDNVRAALKQKNAIENMFLVDDVHKFYTDTEYIKSKKSIWAVKGVTFAAKLGECLAILGTHSSGKTALVNMMAGNEVMTRGQSCIQNTFLRRDRMKYIHKICLSSSTGGMDDFMTGLDNLVFVAKLHGYTERMAYYVAFKALSLMGLLHNKVTVSEYSSGCLRRLSLCSVLVLAPPVAFLDEPMGEIDANSKSLVAKAMQHLKDEPAAIILTETSLDWKLMQPVCDRIAIMSKGQFAILGPAEEVLDSIARGYMARIKLRMVTAYRRDKYDITEEEGSDSEPEDITKGLTSHTDKSMMFAQTLNDFKADFLKTFQSSKLFSEHLCMLFFYIYDHDKSHRYSTMFKKLQDLKAKYPDLIEDYILSFTTVEDFFWALEYKKGKPVQDATVSATFIN